MAIVVEGPRGRIYLRSRIRASSRLLRALNRPGCLSRRIADRTRAIGFHSGYGLTTYRDLFTRRQLVALTTFSDLVRKPPTGDRRWTGTRQSMPTPIATYLGIGCRQVSRLLDLAVHVELTSEERARCNTFVDRLLPMTWDFAEVIRSVIIRRNFEGNVELAAKALEVDPRERVRLRAATRCDHGGSAQRRSCFPQIRRITTTSATPTCQIFSTFGCGGAFARSIPNSSARCLFRRSKNWSRRRIALMGAKSEHKSSSKMVSESVCAQMRRAQHPDFPLTVYYAFKQAESEDDGRGRHLGIIASTGWETMLEGLLRAGFQVTGTWPMRSELSNRSTASGTNALASSIVLVCRPRPESAPITTRKDFLASLKKELPHALRNLQKGNIAPSILRRPPLVQAWRSSRDIRRSLKPTARRCECEQPWRSSIKVSTRSSPSWRANSILTRAGRLPGLSSTSSTKGPMAKPKCWPQRKHSASRISRRRAFSIPARVRSGCCAGKSFPKPGTRPRLAVSQYGKSPST